VPDSSRPDPPAGSASTRSLADAVSALREATDALKDDPAAGERERYYRRLEERGVLVDVDEDTDLSSLPSTVTHVRHPDGGVERLGYS
jgi:hypothetical protein